MQLLATIRTPFSLKLHQASYPFSLLESHDLLLSLACFLLYLAPSLFLAQIHFLPCMFICFFCLDLHVCMHVLCSYAFICLYACIHVLPCFYAYVHMLRGTFTCLNAYFHAYMCRSVCLHAQIDVLYMLYAIFHMLVHSMPCLCAQTQAMFVIAKISSREPRKPISLHYDFEKVLPN